MTRKSALFWIFAVGLIMSAASSVITFIYIGDIKKELAKLDPGELVPGDTIAERIQIEPIEPTRTDTGATYIANIETIFRPFPDSVCLPCDTADQVPEVVINNDPIKVEPDPEPDPAAPVQKFTWIIDAGHSALTKGKRSPVWSNSSQLYEWEFNRDMAGRITRKLIEEGVSVVWINNTIDPVTLGKRVRLANQVESHLPTRILSIHANAANSSKAHGVETWFYKLNVEGREMAKVFQSHIIDATGLRDRGVKAGNFYILRKPDSPAVLTENGFYTNPDESALMLTEDFRRTLADAHVAAILELEGRTPAGSNDVEVIEDGEHDHDHDHEPHEGTNLDPLSRPLGEIKKDAGSIPAPSVVSLR